MEQDRTTDKNDILQMIDKLADATRAHEKLKDAGEKLIKAAE